jgi:hypothetical protein
MQSLSCRRRHPQSAAAGGGGTATGFGGTRWRERRRGLCSSVATPPSRATSNDAADAAPRFQAQDLRAGEAFERTWNRAARPVLDGLWSAIASAAAAADAEDADDQASSTTLDLLPLYADAHLALLRDAEGTARQAWSRHPDDRWRAAGRRVAQDAGRAQARLLGGTAAAGGNKQQRPQQARVRRALEREGQQADRNDNHARLLLCRALVEQLDFRIAAALAAEAEAEAAMPPPDRREAAAADTRPGGRLRRRQEEEEEEEGGMWRAAFDMQQRQQQKQNQKQRDPRRELLLALHAARRGEAAATAAAAAAAAGSAAGPPLVELEGAEMVQAATAVPGLEPYLLLPPDDEQQQPPATARAVLALALPAVRRCLLQSPAEPLRRLAYERGLAPAVEAATAVLPEVWRFRAEAARCVAALQGVAADDGGADPPPPSPALPDAARRLCPDPDAALAFLFELLDAVRPAADAEVELALGDAAPWDVEYLLMRRREGEEDGGNDAEAAAVLARALAPNLRLGGVLRGLARASAELLGIEIAKLPPGPHPDRPPDLPDHCPAFAVAVPHLGPSPSSSPLARAGVVALDPCSPAEGGYGTRVVRLRFPVVSSAKGPDALVPSPEHAVVAIGLALEVASGSGGVGGGGRGDGGGGGPLPVDDPSSLLVGVAAAATTGRALRLEDVEAEVLPPSALWELAHEFGHALHLLLSNMAAALVEEGGGGEDEDEDEDEDGGSPPASSFAGTPLAGAGTHHLAGRFLPSDALEAPSQLFERLMLEPLFLSRVCLALADGDDESGDSTPLPAADARRLACRLRRDYASALPVQDKALAAVAEQLCVLGAFYGGGSDGNEWASARASASSLVGAGVAGAGGDSGDGDNANPPFVATLRQAAMLPVVARHRGTYHSYSLGWAAASALGDEALAPLVRALFGRGAGDGEAAADDSGGGASVEALRERFRAAMSAHAGLPADELARVLGLGPLPGGLWPKRGARAVVAGAGESAASHQAELQKGF